MSVRIVLKIVAMCVLQAGLAIMPDGPWYRELPAGVLIGFAGMVFREAEDASR